MIYKREKAHFWLNCVGQKRASLPKPPNDDRNQAGGHFLICPIRVCAVEQGMIFKVLRLNQGIQFHYLAS